MPDVRLDRFLTLHLFERMQRMPACTELPVLMYHSISDDSENNVAPYYRTATSPKIFAEQMALLRAEGFQAVGLQRGRELLRQNGNVKPVVITFDDGYRDFYTHAFPVLQQFGFAATMFLPTAFIGEKPVRFKE